MNEPVPLDRGSIQIMTPEEMTRAARNYSAAQNEANVRSGDGEVPYEFLFDSYELPASEGIRNSVIAARQLLFRIGSVFVDLEVGRETDSNRASITGQVLDSSNPGCPPSGVPIALLDAGRPVASTSSNDHGEFRLQFALKDNLKLSVELERHKPVQLPITPGRKSRTSARIKRCHPLGSVENRALVS